MGAGSKSFDRRADARVEIATVAIVLARHNPGIEMTIECLSIGGARLVGPGTFALQERIQILFEINGKPVEIVGEVVRVEHGDILTDRIAVRFVSVDEGDRDAIRELVRRDLTRDAAHLEGEAENE